MVVKFKEGVDFLKPGVVLVSYQHLCVVIHLKTAMYWNGVSQYWTYY